MKDKKNVSGKDLIRHQPDVKDLKKIMQSKVGSPFTTNVLRIALNFKEVTCASVLVYDYKVCLDESMLVRAVKTNQLQFLYCSWAFQKNYERRLEPDQDVISDDSDLDIEESAEDEDEEGKIIEQSAKYRTYTFDMLFKLILKNCPDSFIPKIRAIAGFGIYTSENFTMSLLINRMDIIAADPRLAKDYSHDLTSDLLIFAIRN